MRRLKTIRARFALWTASLLLLVLVAYGAFVYFSLAAGLSAGVDDSLQLSAAQALAALNVENGQVNFAEGLPESSAASSDLRAHGLTMWLLDEHGQVTQAFGPFRALSISAGASSAVLGHKASFTTVTDAATGEPVRVITLPLLDNGRVLAFVQVGQSLASVRQALGRLLTALGLGVPLVVVAAGAGGYFLAVRALTPIDLITRAARRMSAENLSSRLNLHPGDDEVGRLAATFDEMLARLDAAFRRERQFTADASHELRTPLAAMQAITSVTLAGQRTPEEYRQALHDLSEEINRLRGLVDDLLQLARGDAWQPGPRQPVDLTALLSDVCDSLRPLAEQKGLGLTCSLPQGMLIHGDSDGLVRLFVNLLDNAIKYTPSGAITVVARSGPGEYTIAVSDSGVGIPAEHLPHVFDRFYRVDPSRSRRGAGLGLAIAQEIARAHAGSIEVASQPGAGSTFTVHLPR